MLMEPLWIQLIPGAPVIRVYRQLFGGVHHGSAPGPLASVGIVWNWFMCIWVWLKSASTAWHVGYGHGVGLTCWIGFMVAADAPTGPAWCCWCWNKMLSREFTGVWYVAAGGGCCGHGFCCHNFGMCCSVIIAAEDLVCSCFLILSCTEVDLSLSGWYILLLPAALSCNFTGQFCLLWLGPPQ